MKFHGFERGTDIDLYILQFNFNAVNLAEFSYCCDDTRLADIWELRSHENDEWDVYEDGQDTSEHRWECLVLYFVVLLSEFVAKNVETF